MKEVVYVENEIEEPKGSSEMPMSVEEALKYIFR